MPPLYISIDTCVWLKLLSIDFNNEDNYLEEFCYWIEGKHLGLIMPTNMIDEWNRNKVGYQNDIVAFFNKKEKDNIHPFKHNTELASTYVAGEIEKKVQERIERIDRIFSNICEKAPFTDAMLLEAADRNLRKIAPNHSKDSYRDTVNILSLIHYLKSRSYPRAIFTTLNFKDFSKPNGKRFELHDQLQTDFASSNLSYEYFAEEPDFGKKLFASLRRVLAGSSYQNYLKDKRARQEAAALTEKKAEEPIVVTGPDADYLENIKYIDLMAAKKTLTAVEQDFLKSIIRRHDSYKQYFFSKVGENGMV